MPNKPIRLRLGFVEGFNHSGGRNQRQRCSSAFTLIEVLVVVAIIGLLVSILVPSLSKAREATRRTVCKSDVKQLSMAMLYHANDDKKGTYIYTTAGADDGLHYLFKKRYMPDPKIIICPGTQNVVDSSKKSGMQKLPETGERIPIYKDMSHAAKHRHDDSGGHSYEIFAWHSAGVFPSGLRFDKEERISLPRTKRPYMQFIIADSDQDPENNGSGGVVLGALVHNNWPDAATNNHGKDGGNIGFLDGHGEWVTHRNWVPVHLRSAHLAWPEALARETYFPGLRKEARTDGGEGYVWYLQ